MIGTKQSGSLILNAGKVLIDLALNRNSNHAVANSAVSAKFDEIDSDLADLEQEVQKMGTPILDYDNPMHTFSAGSDTYITTDVCYLTGTITLNAPTSDAVNATLSIDGTVIYYGSISASVVKSDGGVYFPPQRLNVGQVIALSSTSNAKINLHILTAL